MKKNVFIVISILLLIGLVIAIYIHYENDPIVLKEQIEKRIKMIGSYYYEEFYYDTMVEVLETKESFSKYKEKGIKINLSSLSSYEILDDYFKEDIINKRTGNKCDYDSTIVIIYPEEPYNKENYHLDVILECGFEK